MKSVLFTYSFKEGLIGITRRKPYHTFRISEFPNSKALLCSMCRYIFILSFFVLETLACCGQTISPIIQTGHLDDVQVMQFTEDGKYLLSGGMDGMIIEWEMSSKMQTGSITGITGGVSCFKYNQEHKLLVAGSYENRVYVYDLDSSYEPVIEYEFDEYVTSVAISNDGKTIAAASADFSLTVFREDTIIRSFTRGDVVGLCFSKDNQTLYFGNYTGHVYRLDTKAKSFNDGVEMVHLAEEHISDIALSPEEKYLAFGTNGVNESGGTLGVVKLKNNKLLREEKVYVTYLGFQNNTIAFFDEKTIVFKDQDDELSKWIFRKNKILKLVNKTLYSGLAVSLDKRWVAYFNEEKLKLVNPLNVAQERILQGKAENPSRIVGVFDNQLFAEYPSGIKQWDVKKLNATLYKEKFYEDKWDYIAFSRDLTLVGNSFSVREANTGLRVGPYFTHAGNVRLAGFSHDNDFFFLLDENGQFTVSCLDTLNRPYWAEKIVRKWYFDKNYAFQHIDEIAISPTENKLAIMAEGFYLFDLESGEFTNYDVSIRNSDVNLPALFDPIQNRLLVASSREAYDTIAYEGRTGFDREWVSKKVNRIGSENDQYINRLNGIIKLFELDSLEAPYYLIRDSFISKNAEVTSLAFDSMNSRIIVGYSDGNLKQLSSSASGYYYYNHTKFTTGIVEIALSEDSKYLYVTNQFGAIAMLNNENLEYLVSLVSTSDNEFVAMDIEGYYKRSKNAQNAVGFLQGSAVMQLSQIDEVLNQPHKVMRKIGLVKNEKIEIIQRLSNSKGKKTLTTTSKGPNLEIWNEGKLHLVTNKGEIKITTLVNATDTSIQKMKIWLNGIPYRTNESVAKRIRMQWKQKWKLPLRRGSNEIRFICIDKAGHGSVEKVINVTSTKPYVKPNLYIATISVAEYLDSSMNLTYTVKDGRDFSNVYVNSEGRKQIGFPSRFGKVFIDSFFNQDATKENIVQWKNKLKESKPEDYVVLYVSGHGLLDSAFNFWFATHDIDFNVPEKRGMSFHDLESLLVDIPAQQKLFLMDACHSGEVIIEEIIIDSTFTLPDGTKGVLKGYTYKGAGVVDMDGEEIDKGELKQELFSNYDSKSGATVISAASGKGLAQEGPDWNNGVFTYTLIGGLIYRWADSNNDGEVSVVELSRYVTEMVKRQTHGTQVPNDRQENIENNFRVW